MTRDGLDNRITI